MTFSQALEGYWLAKKREFSPHTVDDYARTFARFEQFIGAREVGEITATDVHRFLNQAQIKYKLSNKTLSNVWVALSSFFTWAVLEFNISHPIHGLVRRPSYRRPPIEAYTEIEIKALLAACDTMTPWHSRRGKRVISKRPTAPRDKAILILLLDTGLRASELCDLRLRDYEPGSGRLLVRHGKGNKKRTVFLGETSRRHLWRYLSTRLDTLSDDPLFTTRSGSPLDRGELLNMIVTCAKRAGVSRANVHRFRHTFAITFLRNGGNVLTLQKLLGHEKMETLRIYIELAQIDLQRAQQLASPADHWGL